MPDQRAQHIPVIPRPHRNCHHSAGLRRQNRIQRLSQRLRTPLQALPTIHHCRRSSCARTDKHTILSAAICRAASTSPAISSSRSRRRGQQSPAQAPTCSSPTQRAPPTTSRHMNAVSSTRPAHRQREHRPRAAARLRPALDQSERPPGHRRHPPPLDLQSTSIVKRGLAHLPLALTCRIPRVPTMTNLDIRIKNLNNTNKEQKMTGVLSAGAHCGQLPPAPYPRGTSPSLCPARRGRPAVERSPGALPPDPGQSQRWATPTSVSSSALRAPRTTGQGCPSTSTTPAGSTAPPGRRKTKEHVLPRPGRARSRRPRPVDAEDNPHPHLT